MLEELRISLFAQEVKTAFPVSLKRLQKRWEELGGKTIVPPTEAAGSRKIAQFEDPEGNIIGLVQG